MQATQTRLDLALRLVDRGPEVVVRPDEGKSLEKVAFLVRQVAIEVAKAEVEAAGVVLDPHEFAERLDEAVLVSRQGIQPVTAGERFPHQRHEVRMKRRHRVEVPSNALRVGDAVETDRLFEPTLVVDQHHRGSVTLHLDEPIGFRGGHVHDHEIDREVVRDALAEVEGLGVAVRRRFGESVPLEHPHRVPEPRLQRFEDTLDVLRRRREHGIQVAQGIGPAGGVGSPQPGDPDTLVRNHMHPQGFDDRVPIHPISLAVDVDESGPAPSRKRGIHLLKAHRDPYSRGATMSTLFKKHPMLVTTVVLATAAPALAQDHEPMRLSSQNRGNWVEIFDELWWLDEYDVTFNGTGPWADSGERSNSGANGTSIQWTRIDEDYIGGYFHSSMSSFGGVREEAGNVLQADFEVDRTGRMHATAASLTTNLLECVAAYGFVPNGLRAYYLGPSAAAVSSPPAVTPECRNS